MNRCKTWIGLTAKEKHILIYEHLFSIERLLEAAELKLQEKNSCPPCNQDCEQGRQCPTQK